VTDYKVKSSAVKLRGEKCVCFVCVCVYVCVCVSASEGEIDGSLLWIFEWYTGSGLWSNTIDANEERNRQQLIALSSQKGVGPVELICSVVTRACTIGKCDSRGSVQLDLLTNLLLLLFCNMSEYFFFFFLHQDPMHQDENRR